MHVRAFYALSFVTFTLAVISSIFWQLQNYNAFAATLGAAAIGAVAVKGAHEYIAIWHKMSKNENVETYRMLRVVSLGALSAYIVVLIITLLQNDVQTQFKDGTLNEVLTVLLWLGPSLYVLAIIPNIMLLCDENVFGDFDTSKQNEKKMQNRRRLLSFSILHDVVIGAFGLAVAIDADSLLPSKDENILKHILSSLLIADVILLFLHAKYISKRTKGNSLIISLYRGIGTVIIYVVMWRRIHLSEESLVEMKFYDDDYLWVIGAVVLLAVDSGLQFARKCMKQKCNTIVASFGVVCSTFILFFTIIAIHNHHRTP